MGDMADMVNDERPDPLDVETKKDIEYGHSLVGSVRILMWDGQWRTLREISASIDASEASCSARLRDLRKKKFGGHTIERRRKAGCIGIYEYRLIPNPDTQIA